MIEIILIAIALILASLASNYVLTKYYLVPSISKGMLNLANTLSNQFAEVIKSRQENTTLQDAASALGQASAEVRREKALKAKQIISMIEMMHPMAKVFLGTELGKEFKAWIRKNPDIAEGLITAVANGQLGLDSIAEAAGIPLNSFLQPQNGAQQVMGGNYG